MRALVCGSRSWTDLAAIKTQLREIGATEIIHGAANGADALGAMAAFEFGLPVLAFPANWKLYGKRAGIIRNQQMLIEGQPDIVLAFWDGESRGTLDMITRAERANIKVVIRKARLEDI